MYKLLLRMLHITQQASVLGNGTTFTARNALVPPRPRRSEQAKGGEGENDSELVEHPYDLV